MYVHTTCMHRRECFSRDYLDMELQSWEIGVFKILIDIVKLSSKDVVPLTLLPYAVRARSHSQTLVISISMYIWPRFLVKWSIFLHIRWLFPFPLFCQSIYLYFKFNVHTFNTLLNTILIIDLLKLRKFVALFISSFQEYFFILFKQK